MTFRATLIALLIFFIPAIAPQRCEGLVGKIKKKINPFENAVYK
jgi:hypothetical protein